MVENSPVYRPARMGASRSWRKMNPAALLVLRRLIIVPSMLLITVFCIWTFCGLVAFAVFSQSHHCTAQECTSMTGKAVQLVVLSKLKALNLEASESEEATVSSSFTGSSKVKEDGVGRSTKSAKKEQEPEDPLIVQDGDTVASLEHAEESMKGQDQKDSRSFLQGLDTVANLEHAEDEQEQEDSRSYLQELKSLGFSEGTNRESARRKMVETEEDEDDDYDQDAFILKNVGTGAQVSETEQFWNQNDSEIIRPGLLRIMNELRDYTNHSSTSVKAEILGSDSCTGRWIYSYDLPTNFNRDLVALCASILPWYSMCDYFENAGMGKPVKSIRRGALRPPRRWHQTNQYMLDVLFHARLKEYPCLTDDPSRATLFHIPYYGGIDVFRYHYANVSYEKKDELGHQLVRWLEQHSSWIRRGGRDHFLVLGKITWDFRRHDTDWGNTLLMFPELQNVTRLLLERDPWNRNDIGVPHPTYFHPRTDSDMETWLRRVRLSHRDRLFSFAGMPRSADNIRSMLIHICKAQPTRCRFLECSGDVCFRPEATMGLFLASDFCLQPVGDSATRRSVFDSLIAGCIPVLFSELTAYVQYPWHLPSRLSEFSVYISEDDIKSGRVDVGELLSSISPTRRKQMRDKIIRDVIPRLVYAAPGSNLTRYEDAFDVSVRSLLEKSRRINLEEPPAAAAA